MELLFVVTIIAILASLGIATVTSGRLTNAGTLVVDLASQARENSIAKHVVTALILVNNSSNANWNKRLFVLAELDSGSTTWIQVSKWEELPQGTLVDTTQSNFSNPAFTNPPRLVYQGVTLTASSCLYQMFLPDGSLQAGGSTSAPMLYFVSGVMNGATITNTGKADYFEITLNTYTGLPKIDRP